MKIKNKLYIKVLANFTLAKFISALITITMLAAIKYAITGNFYIEYCNFFTNIAVGLLGYTINTGFSGLLSEYLGLKGLNLNLKELMFGFEKLEIGGPCLPKGSDKLKLKFTLTMDSGGDESNTKPLDKGKGVYTEPIGARGFSGRDPSYLFLPKTNPGPGFNVPGGEVPIRDEICKHINYNPHILRQFKTMDLETAVEQRNNNYILIRNMISRLAYAENALRGEPAIPTTEHQYNLRNLILRDLKEMNEIKIKAEGRIVLLNSRIEFIENNTRKN
jgi:hypothetical protein